MSRTLLLVLVLVAVLAGVLVLATNTASAAVELGAQGGQPGPPPPKPAPIFSDRNPPAATAAGIDCSTPEFAADPRCAGGMFKSATAAVERMIASGNYAVLSPDAPAGALGFRPNAPGAVPPKPAGGGGWLSGASRLAVSLVAGGGQ